MKYAKKPMALILSLVLCMGLSACGNDPPKPPPDSFEGMVKESKISMRSLRLGKGEMKRSWGPIARGTSIGSFFGILPGTGSTIASFISYAVEKKISKTPERFGHGAIEGIAGPESSNNAAAQTAFIPTMSLGIPGDAVMALMLGAPSRAVVSPEDRIALSRRSLELALEMVRAQSGARA